MQRKPAPPDQAFSISALSTEESNSPRTVQTIETIAVLGAGTMGHGIAQVAAFAGYRVILRDVEREALARGVRSIERNLDKGIQLGKLTDEDRDMTLQRIRGAVQLTETADADLFIEAAPEVLEIKQNILREVERTARQTFIF